MTRPADAGRPRFDIGEIVREHREALEAVQWLSPGQRRVLTDMAQCRTAALGGHLEVCPNGDYERPAYNSCRNRHCPKCQALAQEAWIEERRERLLDVGHFHVVFTVPSQLRSLAKFAPNVVYAALFSAASETLRELADTRLGATLGVTMVLHTWTRELLFHPHVHAIVTAGGLSHDGATWVRCRHKYLFPVRMMGTLLCGKMIDALRKAHRKGSFKGFDEFEDPQGFDALMMRIPSTGWNVHAKAPFAKSQHVLAYLGRYTHRVGIANSRLLDVSSERVTFRTRGDAIASVTPVVFLQRLVQHVLPDRFHKIRHYGLYASGANEKAHVARALLGALPATTPKRRTFAEKLLAITGRDIARCPRTRRKGTRSRRRANRGFFSGGETSARKINSSGIPAVAPERPLHEFTSSMASKEVVHLRGEIVGRPCRAVARRS